MTKTKNRKFKTGGPVSNPVKATRAGDVFLGYLHPNELAASFHRSLMDLVQYDQTHSARLKTWAAVRAPGYGIDDARNTVASQMLESDAEWLFFVDADMGFAPWVVDQLLLIADENNLKLVGGLAFAWREQGFDGMNGLRSSPLPTIYDYLEEDGVKNFRCRAHYPVNELVRVAATGCALLLIHRSVLEQVAATYGPIWFDRITGPTGIYGEDISFFVRTGALGIPAYVHTGVRTNHLKNIWVSETDFWESFHAPPATTTVDVIVPTVKARTANIPALAQSLKASTGLARLLLVVDDEDHALEVKEYGDTLIAPGRFAEKINAAYPHTQAPWIQVVGDDCVFHPGWFDQQVLVADLYGAKVIGSNDMANPRVMRGEHATHWMIARDYIDEQGASWDGPGIIAHEGYRHWFVDDEIVTVAKQRGVFQAALGAKIEHLHPITGNVAYDAVYEANDAHAETDQRLYARRLRDHAG